MGLNEDLLKAVKNRDFEEVSSLIKNGADVNKCTYENNDTGLSLASEKI